MTYIHTHIFDFESTFIKAEGSETRKGLGWKKHHESPGGAALVSWEGKRGLETGSGDQPGTSCCCPLLPTAAKGCRPRGSP